MTEYGGDTISGFHTLPSYVWTEDYQCDLVSNHVKVLKIILRSLIFVRISQETCTFKKLGNWTGYEILQKVIESKFK